MICAATRGKKDYCLKVFVQCSNFIIITSSLAYFTQGCTNAALTKDRHLQASQEVIVLCASTCWNNFPGLLLLVSQIGFWLCNFVFSHIVTHPSCLASDSVHFTFNADYRHISRQCIVPMDCDKILRVVQIEASLSRHLKNFYLDHPEGVSKSELAAFELNCKM